MSKHVTCDQLVDGVLSFAKTCIKHRRTPFEQLDYSNGKDAASFNKVIFHKPELYWPCMRQMMTYEKIKPASELYIAGYNDMAIALGIPKYNSFGFLVNFTSTVVLQSFTTIQSI